MSAHDSLIARIAQLEQLCAGFVRQVRDATPILRRIETAIDHEAEGMRALELPASHRTLSNCLTDLRRIRRALSHEADRLLGDTQPITLPAHAPDEEPS